MKSIKKVSGIEIEKRVAGVGGLVRGEFRQEETLTSCRNILKNWGHFTIATFEIKVGSGFYVRTFADDIGKKLKTGAVVYSLNRITVGEYGIENAL